MALSKSKKGLIYENLQKLNAEDTTSLLLFTLWKLTDSADYGALSELAYVLDGDNLSKFLAYYGGMTIKVPTLKEFRLMIEALKLFQIVNLDNNYTLNEALKVVAGNEFTTEELLKAYMEIVNVVKDYEFAREEE